MLEPVRLTKSFYRELLYKRQYPEFINVGLVDYLGLKPQTTLNLPLQKTGNCSWANVEAVIPAMMFSLLAKEHGNHNSQKYEEEALNFYHEWRKWYKDRSLDFCIQSLKEASPARKASKAALLAAILFQACDNDNPKDRAKFNKILAILSQADYLPILKCYAKTFSKENKTALWKSFSNYLEDYGVDIDNLLILE